MEPVAPAAEPELDPRELKALSRQERKAAKAALRREQQEARNAARQAKASAKAAARLGAAAPAVSGAADVSGDVTSDEDITDETSEKVDDATVADVTETDATDERATDSADAAPVATDPRARAAQRVQRRLGKDAEKLSAAEARARAREEARRRRAQAKEQRSGVVAEEAVRPPEEATEGNLTEDVSVERMTEQTIEAVPFIDEPAMEPAVEESAVEEPAVDDVIEEPEPEPEPEMPKPVVDQRIDVPAPLEAEEPEPELLEEPDTSVAAEPEPVAEWTSGVETREIPRYTPAPASPDSTDETKSRSSSLAPVAGVVGLIALGISVLLAVGALLVALGFDSGGLYEGLRSVANLLVGPLKDAFDFSGANAERKEHFLAWGAGSIAYLLISFAGQAVQRANDEG